MRKISSLFLSSLVVGMLAFGAAPLLAGEHGGSTVGGSTSKEHGGTSATEGSHGMEMSDEVAILQQAANELKATNPELSKKLEDLANKHKV